jgi:hypothetical protein
MVGSTSTVPLTIQVPSGCLVAVRSSVWLPSVGGPRVRRTSFASQRGYGAAAQIAVVAHMLSPRVGRGPAPIRQGGVSLRQMTANGLIAGAVVSAVTAQHGMQGDDDDRHKPVRMLSSNPKAELARI